MTSPYPPQWPSSAPAPAPGPPRRRRWPWLLGSALIVLVLAGTLVTVLLTNGNDRSGTNGSPGASTFTMEGTLYVANCAGLGYSDLLPGAQVTVTARDGRVLGIGTVRVSDAVANRSGSAALSPEDVCTSTFEVPDLPVGQGLYGVHVGNQNRGVLWQSEDDAHTGVHLSVGS